jgi:hypothetical protein
MNRHLGLAAVAAAAAALAVPAVASAHTTVYTTTAKKFEGGVLSDFTRYVVVNHGYTVVLTESNGLTGPLGVVAFNNVPSGAYRNSLDTAQILANGGTGAQAHATCNGSTAQLDTAAVIASWQGGLHSAPTPDQPFWNYVPFQTTSANLDDNPATWTPTLVQAGFSLADLATPAGAKAACEAKGGLYFPADTLTTTSASLSSGLTTPLQKEIDTLKAASTTQTTQVASLTSEVNTLKTQVAGMMLAATPLKLTYTSGKARSGVKVAVNGQPLKAVKLQLSLKQSAVRKHKLAPAVIGNLTTTTDASGNAAVTVKLTSAAAKALKSLKGSLAVTVEAKSGDRFTTTNGKMTR